MVHGVKRSFYKDLDMHGYDLNNLGVINDLGLYIPGREILECPSETVITNFQAGHGFTKESPSGTQVDDNTNYVKGDQSMKLTTNGVGASTFSSIYSIAPVIDMTAKYFKVWIYVDDPTKISELMFYIASVDDWTNRYTWDIPPIKANTWVPLTLSFGMASTAGAPNRAAIQALRVKVKDDGTGVINANFGGWSSITEPTNGVVSIVFDDGWENQYLEARKKMDDYGFAGTAYIIPDKVGIAGQMTLTQLKKLQNLAGWDISSHASEDLTLLNAREVEELLLSIKNYLLKNGFSKGVDDFAYPFGKYDETTVLPLVRKYFRSARTIVSYAETIPPADYYKLRVMLVLNTTTTAAIATAVDRARLNKEWLILVFHKIVAVPTVETEYSIANFGTVIDDINTDGIIVKTVSDVLRG